MWQDQAPDSSNELDHSVQGESLLRRIAVVAVALLAFGGPLMVERALAGPAADLVAMTNADRAAKGLKALSTAGDLSSFAQQRADEMARSGKLAHTTNLGSRVSGWKRLGENVGRGPTLQEIEAAFMASPSHRENILDPGFTQIGVGVTFDGKEFLYVAVIFRQPTSGTATATPAPTQPRPRPATPPTTRAASAPKPKPTTTTQAPTTTTTEAPTTTTTAPPPPPPVEPVVAAAVEPPVETTTTTAPRPIFANPDFLAANFSDGFVPVSATTPLPAPGRALPILFAAALGLLVGAACITTALRHPDQLPELCRRRHWR